MSRTDHRLRGRRGRGARGRALLDQYLSVVRSGLSMPPSSVARAEAAVASLEGPLHVPSGSRRHHGAGRGMGAPEPGTGGDGFARRGAVNVQE